MEYSAEYNYCEAHTTLPHPILRELERVAYQRTLRPQQISGAVQGQLLNLLVKISGAERILEVGTFVGYSTICMAAALPEGGHIDTIEANDELGYLIREYFEKSGLQDRISLYLQDAGDLVPTLVDNSYDLIFMDAGKRHYRAHYELCLPKLRPGGLLLADNLLWRGKVYGSERDPDTDTIRAFNDFVHADERTEQILLPLRDGLMLIRKL